LIRLDLSAIDLGAILPAIPILLLLLVPAPSSVAPHVGLLSHLALVGVCVSAILLLLGLLLLLGVWHVLLLRLLLELLG